jgi:ABC-type sugar transport system permease subunit
LLLAGAIPVRFKPFAERPQYRIASLTALPLKRFRIYRFVVQLFSQVAFHSVQSLYLRQRSVTMSVAIYTEVSRNNYRIASALSTVLTVTIVISLLVFFKVSGKKSVSL